MEKLKILCDLDDVLFPLIEPWVGAINNTYKTKVRPCDITNWDITQFFPSLSKHEIFAPLNNARFWEELVPVEDGNQFISQIIKDGHTIKIVTATHYDSITVKMQRLLKCYPQISYEDVIITSDKQIIKGDVLIDDAVHNLIGGDYQKILMGKPHNKWFNTEKTEITRVYSLTEAYTIIQKILK